ncbi:MFS transporter [Solirubrobacter sp. CPCC 204708]|uniref:MFS transporter n=1 Tax=Solirubrobacter deserti TaxID=2282478 RepID=A0ABT4RQ16_9ACTN|nr:MFS transporter [Solirubrobacter deserti]MBE2320607.1 MFS transporter [Solirubrobacter deserti]MDA0140662.1 MFS transporter [Solirubrobacter deserti]
MKVGLPCVAQFVIVLDVTIVAIALPVVQDDLGLSELVLGWVVTVYPLVFGGCLLAAGRIADRYGRRLTFTAGLWVFGGASLLCALAPSGALLLTGRALQGVGAALVSPAALALVTAARPSGRARGRALGWWTAAAAGGGASGWVLGGLLSGWLDWRWVFLVNVPVCLVAALLAPRVLEESRAADPRDEEDAASPHAATAASPHAASLDLPGAVLVTTGLGALVLALSGYPLALVLAAVLLAALFFVERRAANPLLDRRVLGRRAVLSPNAVAAVLTATTTPIALLCVLHVQQDLGLSPATAGLLFPPFNLAVIGASLLGPRRGAIPGGLAAIGAGGLALAISPAIPVMLVAFVVMGAGLGLASVASTAQGTAAVDASDQGLASALLATSAQLGTAFGLALFLPLGFVGAAVLALMLPARTVLRAVARRAAPPTRSPHPRAR